MVANRDELIAATMLLKRSIFRFDVFQGESVENRTSVIRQHEIFVAGRIYFWNDHEA